MVQTEMGDKLMNGVMKWAVCGPGQMIVGLMTGQLGSQIKSRLEFDIAWEGWRAKSKIRSSLLKRKWN